MDQELINIGKRLIQLTGTTQIPFDQPTGTNVQGDIIIAKCKNSGAPFGLNLDELNQHLFIAGRSGSGKTTLIYLIMIQLLRLGIPFWAFDFKQDYRHLIKTRNLNIHVFNTNNFKYNPLRPPLCCEPMTWIQVLTNLFAQPYWLMARGKELIMEHLIQLYTDYGIFEGKDVYPSLQDLLDSLDHHYLEKKYGRESDYLASVKSSLKECILPIKEMLNCDRGFPLEQLLDKTVIFELENLVSETQTFLVNVLIRHLYQFRISNHQRG